ncbi:phytanoyl-CoA dioxygenase family protein [Emcibacter nanhaiensis]|uniref:Phytanoyl-CoA dioxygenase family protein n=1 Tax=Emcibacter nanhaiensis TaxID=1505037 RepID=A0A501P937_9PROT|nr:phytanoyl-CoA dioxygenase family protein [Emcibacter nanhaiensis]TPD56860.1 phytanoyl-CoA dioxygenase family protein [Emcibacter nanhaiensis]
MSLQRFTIETPIEDMVAAVREDGGIIIENVLSTEDIETLNHSFDDAIEQEKKRKTGSGGMDDLDGLMPETMYFATNLPARYPGVTKYINNDVVVDVVAKVLGTARKDVTLNTFQVIESHPGTPQQALHRDDVTWPVPEPRPELCLVTLWALQNFVPEAGGTVIVPGSHKWPDAKVPPKYNEDGTPDYSDISDKDFESFQLEMEPGSVLIFLGSLLHGGGANTTEDLVRRYFHIGYCHSWLRQVENYYVSMDPDTLMGFSADVQNLLGYGYYTFELGHVYNMTPSEYLKQRRSD